MADLQARLAALNAEYARAIDDDRLEEWPGFFLARCLYKITTADNVKQGYQAGLVYADSRAMLQDRVSALREANVYERQRYRHILGAPALLSDGVLETAFLVVRIMRDGKMDLFATGRYLDRVSEEENSLKYAERIVICDSSRFDTLLAIPL